VAGEEVAGCAHDHRREQYQRDEVRERHQSVEDVCNAPHHRDGEVGSNRDHGVIEEPIAFDDVGSVHPHEVLQVFLLQCLKQILIAFLLLLLQ